EINDEACASTLYILPHSLLIVMEFIIAGNGMSEKSPLSIRITVENERVMVRHVFQPKKMMIAHMESQMNNLKERYSELLQELNIEQDTERNERLIKLPLIHAPQKG
ncbi:MAG TPA: hypothetical protein VEV15_01420, partial [Flavisolibacter sp.]|nr:hypothetical protein [Flavisolibacter sp.]